MIKTFSFIMGIVAIIIMLCKEIHVNNYVISLILTNQKFANVKKLSYLNDYFRMSIKLLRLFE